jgi:hypothetical protein
MKWLIIVLVFQVSAPDKVNQILVVDQLVKIKKKEIIY